MPSRSLRDSTSENVGDAVDNVKSFYASAKRGAAQVSADKAASAASASTRPTVRRSTAPTLVGTDPATKDLSAANAATTVSEAPSQIEKSISSMDH